MTALLDLKGKKELIVGIANEHSIAYGGANRVHHAGADLAISYTNDKAEPYVRPLDEALESQIILPCNVPNNTQIETLSRNSTKMVVPILIFPLSYIGSSEVVKNYGLMGSVKVALESAMCYLVAELGQKDIRVNAQSASVIKTRAGSEIAIID